MFAVVLALPIFAIGALVFIFPDILDLGSEGYRKLLERTWQNMKAEPLELTLFGIFALFGLLQSGYVLLTRGRERHSVIGFYKAYRAIVRGKVAALTASDPSVGEGRRA